MNKSNIIFMKHERKEESKLYIFLSLFVLLVCQCVFILIEKDSCDMDIINIEKYIIPFEIVFFLSLYKLDEFLDRKGNLLFLMFIHSTIKNFGMIIFIILHPVFVIAFSNYRELYLVFFYQLLFYFFVAFVFTYNINVDEVIENSLSFWGKKNKRGKYNTIFFYRETLPKFLRKISLMPLFLLMILYGITFLSRGSAHSQYYFVLSFMSATAFMLYGDICYAIFIFKYFLKNKKCF